MLVSHVYRRQPVTIDSSSTIKQALEKMAHEGANGLIVLDKRSGRVAGVLSLQDIAAAVVPQEMQANPSLAEALNKEGFFEETARHMASRKVTTVMRTDFTTVTADAPILEIAADFLQNDLYIVPVVEDDKLVGVISRTEIRQALSAAMQK